MAWCDTISGTCLFTTGIVLSRNFFALFLLVSLSGCLSSPKEPSIADQIRERGKVRLDIAEQLEQGEDKLATAESLQRKADKRLKNADKDEQRAQKLIEEVAEQRELAAKESKKAQALRKEGSAALTAAKAEYDPAHQTKTPG